MSEALASTHEQKFMGIVNASKKGGRAKSVASSLSSVDTAANTVTKSKVAKPASKKGGFALFFKQHWGKIISAIIIAAFLSFLIARGIILTRQKKLNEKDQETSYDK